ncbi:MAG: glycosyltransferase, partial [Muribaculaceae bacterium]|nr:glycosyltransferase [Muribaculaceae bacterium]
MKVLQINAVYGYSSTGVIMKHIRDYSIRSGIESYVAFSKGHGLKEDNIYEIGSYADHKIHALLSRIAGKQGYFSYFATKRLLKYIGEIKPDIVHLHNLHSNYINLNMLLKYLAEKDIITVVTMHDCWYFTGGCFHYA